MVAVLLNARVALHRFVRSMLTDGEMHDLLIFAAATLIVLPLLPDHPIGPYGALNLRTIWLVVILVMGVGALGYIAVRIVGPRSACRWPASPRASSPARPPSARWVRGQPGSRSC